MVIIKNSIKAAVIPIALTSFMVLQGCKDEEAKPESKTNLLIGDWELTEVNGYDQSQSDYRFLIKFESSGDWQFCGELDPVPAYNYCYSAKWKWEDSNEKTIIMNQFQNTIYLSEMKLDVVVLTESKLEGSLTRSSDDPGYTYSFTTSVKYVKIN